MAPADFSEQVVQLRRELAGLQQDLKAADAAGNHRGALAILGRMLELQRTFFRKWNPQPGAADVTSAHVAGTEAASAGDPPVR